ncbi:MAG TPA: CBS domain-containing protein [Alphaproteobacteria bacterium]|nr:CBS domain-containing protein [Alphaproteobacteria bacterium]
MKAQDVMTAAVVSVPADMPVNKIAALLLDKHISAVPVVNEYGVPVGMVSEGDLVGREDAEDRETRREWWLAALAEGELVHPDLEAMVRIPNRKARDVMSTPLVTVTAETDIRDVARLLSQHRIKRVPVVRNGQLIGIVSRADLLRSLAREEMRPGG